MKIKFRDDDLRLSFDLDENVYFGAFLMVSVTVLLSSSNAIAKYLFEDYHYIQVMWARYLFFVPLSICILMQKSRKEYIRTDRPVFQVCRTLILLAAGFLGLYALRYIPLAEATALIFVGPIFMAALSVLLLRERITPRLWAAILMCFVGTIVIVRPGADSMHWTAFLLIASAFCLALYHVFTKMLGRKTGPFTTLFYMGLVGFVLLSLMTPLFWTTPTPRDWVWMFAIGGVYGLAHYIWIRALSFAAASVLAPFAYAEFVTASAIGYLVFEEMPGPHTIVGVGIIILAGFCVIRWSAARADPVNSS